MHDAILAAAPFLAVVALVFGPLAAWSAARRQRNPAVWLLFGALLGPVALLLIRAAPPARCSNCSEPTVGFERRCSTCGVDLRTAQRTPPAGSPAADEQLEPPRLHSVPDQSSDAAGDPRRSGTRRRDLPEDARPDRLSAIGARRPSADTTIATDALGGTRLDLTLLAMGVLVVGSEPLLQGSRYLIARTHDRLLIIGPIEASPEHVELDLPLAGVEANFVADRLVITGTSDGRARRSLLLAFQSVAGLTATAVDQAIMERAAPISIAAGRP